jgi:hypothetical protein
VLTFKQGLDAIPTLLFYFPVISLLKLGKTVSGAGAGFAVVYRLFWPVAGVTLKQSVS